MALTNTNLLYLYVEINISMHKSKLYLHNKDGGKKMIEKVPSMISTKDLDYISDMLNANYLLIKKLNNYLEITQAQDVIKIAKKAHTLAIKNFEELLTVLKEGTP